MATNNAVNNESFPLNASALTVDPGASGDSYVQLDINTTGEWRFGVDDTDGDEFKISQGSAIGTNDTFTMTASGQRHLPLQPSFWAYNSAVDSNITGDGTVFTVIFNTENFDQNGDFDGTSTFTAPITGKYYFAVGIDGNAVTNSVTSVVVRLNINSGSTIYNLRELNAAPPLGVGLTGNSYKTNDSRFISLTASDTVIVQFICSGTTLTVDVLGTTSTFFSGYLVC